MGQAASAEGNGQPSHGYAGNMRGIWIMYRQNKLIYYGNMFGRDIMYCRACSCAVLCHVLHNIYVLCSTQHLALSSFVCIQTALRSILRYWRLRNLTSKALRLCQLLREFYKYLGDLPSGMTL